MEGFLLKLWSVSVDGYGTDDTVIAASQGKALAKVWDSDAFSHISFGDFLKRARCRRNHQEPEGWGDPIIASGFDAFYLGHKGKYVLLALPDCDHVLTSHPLDVAPDCYRPAAYRESAD